MCQELSRLVKRGLIGLVLWFGYGCAGVADAQQMRLTPPNQQVTGVLAPVNGGTGINTTGLTGCAAITAGVWTVSPANCGLNVPIATGTTFGTIKPDGTSCTVTAGVLTCLGLGGISSTPSTSQSIAQPTGTTLNVNSLNGVLNSAQFAGSTPDARASAACAALGGAPGLIEIPPTESAGLVSSTQPTNCLFFESRGYSGNPILSYWTNAAPTETTGGASAFNFAVGNGTFLGASGSNSQSTISIYMNDNGGRSNVFTENCILQLFHPSHIGVCDEIDVSTADPTTPAFGMRIVSAGAVPSTAGININNEFSYAGWIHALELNNITQNAIYLGSGRSTLTTTQAITASSSVQAVTTTYNLTNNLDVTIGGNMSVDTGVNNEVVNVVAASSTTISAVFTKNHASGVNINPYSVSGDALNANPTLVGGAIIAAGSVPNYAAAGLSKGPEVLGVADSTNFTQESMYYGLDYSLNFKDVDAGGWNWKRVDDSVLMSLTASSGISLSAPFFASGNITTLGSVTANSGVYTSSISASGTITATGIINANGGLAAAAITGTTITASGTIVSDSGTIVSGGLTGENTQYDYNSLQPNGSFPFFMGSSSTDIRITGKINGVSLTTTGSATTYLDGTGNYSTPGSAAVFTATGTYTSATSDTFTVTGMSGSNVCSITPTNATAAGAIAAYVSSVSGSSVTVSHVATTASGGTISILCAPYVVP